MKVINGEQFYEITDNSQYLVSQSGLIYSTLKNRLLKAHDNNGYKMVFLSGKWNYVHRIVCNQWHVRPQITGELWVNHKDGNKGNNNISNLEWGSISDNIQHAFDTGLRKIISGKDHWRTGAKISDNTKAQMSAAKAGTNHPKFKGWFVTPFGTFASAREASAQTGICAAIISKKCKSTEWSLPGWEFKAK